MVPSQLTGSEMRNLVFALGGLFVGMMIGGVAQSKKVLKQKKRSKTEEPVKYTKIKFNCWLCTGETIFDASPSSTKVLAYERECKWCGVENRVEVQPVKQ